jgi:copper chaperone
MPEKTFTVPNISCGHCIMTIKNEVGELTGVSRVEADEQTKVVTVTWDDPATWTQIADLLEEINFPAAEAN